MSTSLNDRVVVITGAAGGIGRVLAERFAREGAVTALVDRDSDGTAALAGEILATGGQASAHTCDVTDAAQCADVVEQIRDRWGGVDILINNAGISHRSLLSETRLEVLRQVMDVNFFGAVHFTQAVLRDVVTRRGAVVAISSVAGFAPLVGRCGYAASKHALHGFFDSLRSEIGPQGVDVLLVCPAFIDTNLATNALSGAGGAVASERTVANRPAPPSLVADAVVDGLKRGRRQVNVTRTSKAAYWMSRLVPRLYQRVMLKRQAAEFE